MPHKTHLLMLLAAALVLSHALPLAASSVAVGTCEPALPHFVTIQAASSLGQRFLGQYGAVLVSAVGGLASSASSTAVAASLSRHGQIPPMIAAVCAVLASVASTLVNLPIVYRETRDRTLVRSLLSISLLIAVVGLAALGVIDALSPRSG